MSLQQGEISVIGQKSHLKCLNAVCKGTEMMTGQVVVMSVFGFSFEVFGIALDYSRGTDGGWLHTALLINQLLYPLLHCKSTL